MRHETRIGILVAAGWVAGLLLVITVFRTGFENSKKLDEIRSRYLCLERAEDGTDRCRVEATKRDGEWTLRTHDIEEP